MFNLHSREIIPMAKLKAFEFRLLHHCLHLTVVVFIGIIIPMNRGCQDVAGIFEE